MVFFQKDNDMNITKEQVEELLPQTVKDTEVLTEDAKNMFAVLLNSLLVSKGAEDTGELIIPTDRLRGYVGWRFERMMQALRELERYRLITRTPGKKRVEGESAVATRIVFNWDVIDKPIVRKTYDDLFGKFKRMKTLGKPFGNCNSNSNVNDNVNINLNSNDKPNLNNNENNKDNINDKLNNNDNEKDILEEKYQQEKNKVMEYIEQEAEGKRYSEITRLTIPIYNWIGREYPENSKRLRKAADMKLDRLKKKSLDIVASNTLKVEEYEAGLPF